MWVFCCFSVGGWWSCQSRWRWSGCFLPEAHALVFCNNHVLLNMRITITLRISGMWEPPIGCQWKVERGVFCREFWSLKLSCCNTVSPLFWCWDTVVVRLFHPRKALHKFYILISNLTAATFKTLNTSTLNVYTDCVIGIPTLLGSCSSPL